MTLGIAAFGIILLIIVAFFPREPRNEENSNPDPNNRNKLFMDDAEDPPNTH